MGLHWGQQWALRACLLPRCAAAASLVCLFLARVRLRWLDGRMQNRARRHEDSTEPTPEKNQSRGRDVESSQPEGRTGKKLTGGGSTSLKKKGPPVPKLMAAWHPWTAPILLGVLARPPTPASFPRSSQLTQRAHTSIARFACQDSIQALLSLVYSRSSRTRQR